jgi:hypothetical protein
MFRGVSKRKLGRSWSVLGPFISLFLNFRAISMVGGITFMRRTHADDVQLGPVQRYRVVGTHGGHINPPTRAALSRFFRFWPKMGHF